AILIGVMAVSNFMKPVGQHFNPEGTAGFVFLGTRLHGTANLVMGPLFGALLAAYASGVWTMRRWVVPIACFYAVYVIVNVTLLTLHPPPDQGARRGFLPFMLLYAAVAIGVSGGGAWYLVRNRARLR